MDTIIGALSQLGPVGLALIILVVMWFLNRQTVAQFRAQVLYYQGEIKRLNDDHDEEMSDLRKRRAEDIDELRRKVEELTAEIRNLRAEMETERRLRREAEERAHQANMGRADG